MKNLNENMKAQMLNFMRNNYNFWHGKSWLIINMIDQYKKEINNSVDIKEFLLNNLDMKNIQNMYKDERISVNLKEKIKECLYALPMFNELEINEEGYEKYEYVKRLTKKVINKIEY